MHKKLLIIIAIIIIMLTFSNIVASEITISAEAAILMDATTGQILLNKNINDKHFPASITKVLTALVAIENCELDEIITVGKNVPYQIERGSSHISLIPGEKLTLEQLLYALLVESANDAAIAIAEHISGSVEGFCKLMNDKAKLIGAKDSNFINPNGLHNPDHYTTAYDMALIMKEAIKKPILRNMMSTISYEIPSTEKQEIRYLWTKNKMIKSKNSDYYYENFIAGKTGYTTISRYTLVVAAEKDNMQLISVVLKSEGDYLYTDSIKMLDYGFDNLEKITVVNKNQLIEEYSFEEVSTSSLQIISEGELFYSKNKEDNLDINYDLILKDNLQLPINEGQVIGICKYYIQDEEIGEVNVIAGNSIEKPKKPILDIIKNIIFGIFIFLFIIYIFARFYVSYKNKQIRKRKILRRKQKYYK